MFTQFYSNENGVFPLETITDVVDEWINLGKNVCWQQSVGVCRRVGAKWVVSQSRKDMRDLVVGKLFLYTKWLVNKDTIGMKAGIIQ